MSGDENKPSGPDLAAGVPLSELAEGVPLLGRVGGEPAMLVRAGGEVFAAGATCTHYGGPLAEGFLQGSAVACPWMSEIQRNRIGLAV